MPETRATPDLSYMFYDARIFNFSNVLSSYSSVPRVSTVVHHAGCTGHAGPYCTHAGQVATPDPTVLTRNTLTSYSTYAFAFPTLAVIFYDLEVAVRVPVLKVRDPNPFRGNQGTVL